MSEQQSDGYIVDFDPHFGVFYELMSFRIREILLVSSPYDAYIMDEDGSLAMRIIHEYKGLNLSRPPRITRVTTVAEALELLGKKEFDLVLTMPRLGGMDCNSFGRKVKKRFPSLPVILLSHNVRDARMPPATSSTCYIDRSYVWCCNSDILLAIVKSEEDRRNVDFDTDKAMVRVILLVEDDPGHRSRLLSILYSELVKQTQAVLNEGLNDQHRLLKMRARPKILIAGDFEEAAALFARYRKNIFALLSDVRFFKNGVLHANAGIELVRDVRRVIPDLPVLLFSSEPANEARARSEQTVFAPKDTGTIREDIHTFMLEHLGFGDFVFRTPEGDEVDRASNLHEFEQKLRLIPDASLHYHASRNHFSHWVMAHAEIALASRLHQRHFSGDIDSEQLREDIVFKVHALRKLRQRGVVAKFSGNSYDPEIMDFVKIGQGSLGGKGRGLAFMGSRLQQGGRQDSALAAITLSIPRTCVIATDGFEDFVTDNNLEEIASRSDGDTEKIFLAAEMPDWLARDLRGFLEKVAYPLSVRSSSMLEDEQSQPYAGLYSTFMLANGDPDFEVRYAQLVHAVKLVYASTWFEGPRSFSRSVGQLEPDSMAVIIQQLAGSEYNGYFYPSLSGVAQSYNYYPVPPMASEDGVAYIGLGFGKTVVEGERSLRFSPAFPQHLPQFSTADDILQNAQRAFYCLAYTDPAGFSSEGSNLVRRDIDEAADEFPVRLLCSTYFPEEHRIRDTDLPGQKVLTFAPVLKYDFFPLPAVLTELLQLGREGMGRDIEIEFALDLQEDPAKSVFYFLQIRPIVTAGESRDVRITNSERQAGLLYSGRALGHGLFDQITDIVYVKPDTFDPAVSKAIAAEIGKLNRGFVEDGSLYFLIGPGRWGTADPWLGIPVQWRDISGVGAIADIHGYGVEAEPSQGAHFFHNITSLGIPYLMIGAPGLEGTEVANSGRGINWDWLAGQAAQQETEYVRHVRPAEALVLKVNGRTGEAILLPAKKRKNKETD